MSSKWSTAIVFAMAVVFAAASFVLAQQTPSGTQERMGTGTTSTPSSQMGTMGAKDTIHATVADVNHQQNTLKLKMQGGETVEFKVPEASLSNLNKGDSVQVSIRKAEAQPGMSTTPAPSRPESPPPGTQTR